jgi:hypothetical protein
MLAAVFLLTAAPALADCPVTDLACLPETATDPVTAVTDATTEVAAVASSAVDQATATAEQTAAALQDQASQAADTVTDTVTDTVQGVLGQAPDLDPIGDPTGGFPSVLGSSSSQPAGQPAGPATSGPGGNGAGPTETRPKGAGAAGPSFLGRGPVIGPVPSPISSAPAVSMTIPQQGLFDRIGSLAIQAAKTLAFPVALALIVLLFVMVQNRIDRGDPKLALAPITPDLLRFE